jgi:hypothetical protein
VRCHRRSGTILSINRNATQGFTPTAWDHFIEMPFWGSATFRRAGALRPICPAKVLRTATACHIDL